MIQDFILSILAFFVIDPFRAELNKKLAAAQAPAEVVQQVRSCATAAGPVLLNRAYTDWWWTGTTLVYLSIGMRTPESVLVDVVPSCAPAMRAAQPFLTAARV